MNNNCVTQRHFVRIPATEKITFDRDGRTASFRLKNKQNNTII